MSRLGAPPVPMISRELNRSPAMTRQSSTSPTLDCMEDLEPVTGDQGGVRPAGTKHDVSIPGDRDAALLGRQLHLAEQIGQPKAIGHLAALAIDHDDHVLTPAVRRNRDGDQGWVASGHCPPASTPATASAVAGASR